MSSNINVSEIDRRDKQPLPWSLWLRQIRAIFRLEIEKNFLGRRSILLYLLALIPIAPLALLAPFTPPGREWQDFTQIQHDLCRLLRRTDSADGCFLWLCLDIHESVPR